MYGKDKEIDNNDNIDVIIPDINTLEMVNNNELSKDILMINNIQTNNDIFEPINNMNNSVHGIINKYLKSDSGIRFILMLILPYIFIQMKEVSVQCHPPVCNIQNIQIK